MKTWLKLVAAALLTVAIAVLLVSAVSAQTSNPNATAAVEQMCDYCGDYTDAATSSGTVQSAYRPVVGYTFPYDQAAAPTAARQEHQIRLFRIESK